MALIPPHVAGTLFLVGLGLLFVLTVVSQILHVGNDPLRRAGMSKPERDELRARLRQSVVTRESADFALAVSYARFVTKSAPRLRVIFPGLTIGLVLVLCPLDDLVFTTVPAVGLQTLLLLFAILGALGPNRQLHRAREFLESNQQEETDAEKR